MFKGKQSSDFVFSPMCYVQNQVSQHTTFFLVLNQSQNFPMSKEEKRKSLQALLHNFPFTVNLRLK